MEILNIDDTPYETRFTEKFRKRVAWQPTNPKLVTAFLPGTICEVHVTPGKKVKSGDTVFVFEAMKMLNAVKAQTDGTVKAVHISVGAMVAKGQLLIEYH